MSSNSIEEIHHHMSANGISYDQPIYFDGHIHRFSRDSKRNQRDEWYLGYEGISAKGSHYFSITYGSWSDGSKFTYKSWDHRDYDEKEREEFHREFQKRQEMANLAILEVKNQSAERARQIWEASSLEPEDDSYLKYAALKLNNSGLLFH